MRRLGTFLLLAALLALRLWVDNCTVRTKEYDVPCGIPPGFVGLRIAQISDLHGNEFGPNQSSISTMLRTQRYQAVCVTGDVCGPDGSYDATIVVGQTRPIEFLLESR